VFSISTIIDTEIGLTHIDIQRLELGEPLKIEMITTLGKRTIFLDPNANTSDFVYRFPKSVLENIRDSKTPLDIAVNTPDGEVKIRICFVT
jgi:hypothetical protein